VLLQYAEGWQSSDPDRGACADSKQVVGSNNNEGTEGKKCPIENRTTKLAV
jgi:hypothetical protein